MRIILALAIICLGASRTWAANDCHICQLRLGTTVYLLTDQVTEKKVEVHPDCVNAGNNCIVCSLPSRADFVTLKDGRVYCKRDSQDVVLNDEEAYKICSTVLEDLNRLFSQYTQFPKDFDLEIVDRAYMEVLFKTPGYQSDCGNIYGIMRGEKGAEKFEVKVLGGIPAGRLQATMTHELTHCWVAANVPESRNLHRFAHEGFCELVAYKLMLQKQNEKEQKWIKSNHYTRGQIHLMLEADQRYGFNTVLDWVKYGQGPYWNEKDLDRIRAIQEPKKTTTVAPVVVVSAAPAPPPEKLILKGVSGSGSRRFALINNQTLAVGESSVIKLAKTNVTVKVLEIGADKVKISVGGTEEELMLPGK